MNLRLLRIEHRFVSLQRQGEQAGACFQQSLLFGIEETVLFQRADAKLRSFGAPFWHARNQVDWARQLLSVGSERDRADARALAVEAAATAGAHGCATIERRANEVLEAAG